MKRMFAIIMAIVALQWMIQSFPTRLWADTYDHHTLVRVATVLKEEKALLLSLHVDVVNAGRDWVKALVTREQLDMLESQGLRYEVLTAEMAEDRRLWAEADKARGATAYYTPSSFNMVNPPAGSLMQHLLELYNAHPSITRLYDIGNVAGSSGYDIIAMKVTDNPTVEENEPEIKIYGNIHGDEKSGMMVAADVLDWILAQYDLGNPTALKLVNQAELWFIPMGNPWGAANNSRYNANGIDLNRNFWGPEGNESGSPFGEPETQAIRDLTEVMGNRFVTSISFHAGEICFNSVYNYTPEATPDEPIFFSSRTGGPNGGAMPATNGLAHAYQLGCTTSGFWYTNGYEWYQTLGDTNDWSYYIWSDLDTTVEVTTSKTPPVSQIPVYTAEHRQAVINYMLKTFQGISGLMTNVSTGAPLNGTVKMTATQSSTIPVPHEYKTIFTDPVVGDFHQVLQPATYKVECFCTGYDPVTLEGVVVTTDVTTTVNCQMNGTSLHYDSRQFFDTCPGGTTGDGYIDPEENVELRITLKNTGINAATSVRAQLTTTSTNVTILEGQASFPDIPAGGSAIANAPYHRFRVGAAAACGEILHFTLTILSNQGNFQDSLDLVVGRLTGGSVTVFADDFETDLGWTFNGTGEWQREKPKGLGGSSHGNPDPASAYNGQYVLGNDLSGLGGTFYDYENNVNGSTATSSAINCTGVTGTQVSFRRWLNIESSSYDTARLEVSNNGSSWTSVWQNSSSITENSWSLLSYNISAIADNKPSVYLRFRLDTDSSYQYSGWNIDEFRVTGNGPVNCTMTPCSQAVPALSIMGSLILFLLLGITIARTRRSAGRGRSIAVAGLR